jgi:hypothetical protein
MKKSKNGEVKVRTMTEQETKDAQTHSEVPDTVDCGVVYSPALQQQVKYFAVRKYDAILALVKAVGRVRAEAFDLNNPDVTTGILLTIPLPKEIVDSLVEVDKIMVEAMKENCPKCIATGQNDGCAGFLEKGDVVKSVMHRALQTGLREMLEEAMRAAFGPGGPPRTVRAEDFLRMAEHAHNLSHVKKGGTVH